MKFCFCLLHFSPDVHKDPYQVWLHRCSVVLNFVLIAANTLHKSTTEFFSYFLQYLPISIKLSTSHLHMTEPNLCPSKKSAAYATYRCTVVH